MIYLSILASGIKKKKGMHQDFVQEKSEPAISSGNGIILQPFGPQTQKRSVVCCFVL
ncbi:mCG148240 [Mus musculus]|nr:mCG148240 [Mus musculus]